MGLQGPYGATLNDGAKVSVDVGMHSIVAPMRSIELLGELLHHFAYFPPFNRIPMLVICCTLKHQKLTKTLEKDTA